MSQVSNPKKSRRPLYFTRGELGLILAAYSARVAAGEWRDYALDHLMGSAAFSIFRHTHETPVYVIEKQQRHQHSATGCWLRGNARPGDRTDVKHVATTRISKCRALAFWKNGRCDRLSSRRHLSTAERL